MKQFLFILAALLLVGGSAFAQYVNQDAEGTINVTVIQKADIVKVSQAADFWLVVGQDKNVDWLFKASGDQTATVDIAWDISKTGGITLSDYLVEGNDFNPPTTSQGTSATGSIGDAAFSGGTLYDEGFYWVAGKTKVTATGAGAATVKMKVTLSDYKI